MDWKGAIGVRGPLNDKKFPGEFRLLLAAKPQPVTWTPPASLPDGEWVWKDDTLTNSDGAWWNTTVKKLLGADWTDPPNPGRYRKSGSVATWIGEA
jgi:hypothetical protein